MESKDNLTPAMKQFRHFKAKHPDCILFFRMGDFYETFFDDAKTCSKVLGLTLTSRGKNGPDPVPLAGVPYHAVDGYLKKMLQAGYRVAVCEQVEDPKTAKGVVRRDVVRIVTPGTLTDDMLLEDKKDNFLCAIHLDARGHAVIVGSISPRDISSCSGSPSATCSTSCSGCRRPNVSWPTGGASVRRRDAPARGDVGRLTHAIVTERPAGTSIPIRPDSDCSCLRRRDLEGFGISDSDQDLDPAGRSVIEYLNETQRPRWATSRAFARSAAELPPIDPTSLRSLEIIQTIRSETRKARC
jgi:DNA mismatch repair protein MutS